jgi:Putative Ig domain
MSIHSYPEKWDLNKPSFMNHSTNSFGSRIARTGYWLAAIVYCCCLPQARSSGVCARVGVRLDQTAVMTRTAFRATLEINDRDPALPLQSVGAQVEIKDAAGQPANSQFQIEPPTLANIDSVDGNGTIAASSTASVRWLLIPSDEAAPTAPTEYFVGGQFTYTSGDIQVHVPLEQVKITVYPDAALDLVYFHQRDVYSDDPFTPETEPAVPYALAVMVKNRGAGAAKSLTISSAQPQIVDNEKGLAIDFRLVGAVLDGTNAPNGLTLNFGQVDPGSIRIAEWFFTSSLQGFFRNFSATFQHQDTLGNIHLSTIKSVSIHEMTHIVDAGYGFSDGKPDFLVNDVPDPDNLPDTIYFSDGTSNAVQAVQQCSFDSAPSATHLQVQLTAPTPSGWVYLRLPEPSGGQLALAGVTRSDGSQIKLGVNAWTTDRIFPGPSMRAITTNLLHIFDYNSSGIYTLTYSNAAPGDFTPPTSQVAVLPAQTPQQFPVTWSGQDNDGGSGLASFDIFVSENSGPFLPWLEQTTLRGAIYSGNVGSSYAFYSVATDNAGNKESAHGSPDATTAVTLTNHPPVLAAIPDQTINEGATFARNIIASDPDAGDVLTCSLGSGAPTAMTLNPNSGQLSWPTGEADGPGTNLITVIVRDNGQPSLSATQTFRLVVNEVNSPPTLAAIPPQTATEGSLFSLTPAASDYDIPANTLTFALGPDAPAGMAIDPATGHISWTPNENQGGSNYLVAVTVTDNGIPNLSATQSFTIAVQEVNTAPVLAAIPSQTVDEGTKLTVTVSATDADRPTNRLTFTLASGAPSGAAIDSVSGVFSWTPTEAQGPSTNAIKVVVTDDGSPSLSATQTMMVVVNEVNEPPVLLPVPDQIGYVLTTLRVTNVAVDPDIPANQMSFRLGAAAPAGARINTNSGVFSWTPIKAQAASSNLVTVIVTDDGVPPLSATNSFSVFVGDFLEVSLGSTALLAGHTGSVPVKMDSSTGVTNLTFLLRAPEDRLTDFVLQLLAPEVSSGSVSPYAPNLSLVTLNASDAQPLNGTKTLADLQFASISNQISAFVPLTLQGVTAVQANGTAVPRIIANNGRVVVIGAASLLEALVQTNSQRTLILYGIPQTGYTLESTTNLSNWQIEWQGSLTDLFQVFDGLSSTNSPIFYRARE